MAVAADARAVGVHLNVAYPRGHQAGATERQRRGSAAHLPGTASRAAATRGPSERLRASPSGDAARHPSARSGRRLASPVCPGCGRPSAGFPPGIDGARRSARGLLRGGPAGRCSDRNSRTGARGRQGWAPTGAHAREVRPARSPCAPGGIRPKAVSRLGRASVVAVVGHRAP